MEKRYHLSKNGLMVEYKTMQDAKEKRRFDSRFKRARIKEVLQALPGNVKIGTVYISDNSRQPKEANSPC